LKKYRFNLFVVLTVAGPPGNEVAPVYTLGKPNEQMSVVQGGDLTLECAAEGWPVPHMSWEKYGGHLPNGRYSIAIGAYDS
jgi:hypothetical protein